MVNGLSISGDKVRFFLDNDKFVMNSTMPNGMEISGSNLVIKSDINIEGNLEVLGTTTTINSSIIELSDNRIQLNAYGNQKAGIDISYSNANISFLYDNTIFCVIV